MGSFYNEPSRNPELNTYVCVFVTFSFQDRSEAWKEPKWFVAYTISDLHTKKNFQGKFYASRLLIDLLTELNSSLSIIKNRPISFLKVINVLLEKQTTSKR